MDGTRDLTTRSVTNILWAAWGSGGYAALNLVTLAVLARLLTPAEFGVVAAAMVAINLSKIFYQLGLGPALVQRDTLEPRHLATGFVGSVVFGVSLGIALWAVAPLAGALFRIPEVEPVLRVFAVKFPLLGLAVVPHSELERDMEFRWLANVEVVTFGIGYGAVGITLAFMGAGVWALVAGHVARTVLHVIALVIKRPPPLRTWPEWRAFRELMHYGGGHTIARVGNFFAHEGDNLIVGRWLGAEALGFYGRAYRLMAYPATLVGNVLERVLFPAMARVQRDAKRLAGAYLRSAGALALLMLPVSVVSLVLARELVLVMLGPQWFAAVAPFQIFALGMLFRSSYRLSDALTRATGAVYRRAWRQWLYAGLVLGAGWIGSRWGIAGVATGVLGALVVNFMLMAHLSLRVTNARWSAFVAAHAPALRLSTAAGLTAWVTAQGLRDLALPPLVTLLGTATVTVLLAALLALRFDATFLGPHGRWLLETLRARVPWQRLRARTTDSRVMEAAK